MKNLNIALSDEEYAEVLRRKGQKTHKQLLLESLDIDYTRPPMGRPTAFDPAVREKELMKIHLEKLRNYRELHKDEVARARAELGLDLKRGEKVPALGFAKYKKSEG